MEQNSLKQFIYLSITAAVATILLKFYAFYLTDQWGSFRCIGIICQSHRSNNSTDYAYISAKPAGIGT